MQQSWLKIGGLALLLQGESGVHEAMQLPGMAQFAIDACSADMVIAFCPAMPKVVCQWLHRFAVGEGQAECRFGVAENGSYCYHFGAHGIAVCNADAGSATLYGFSSGALVRFAMWLVYGTMALRHNRLAVHASAVVHGDRAVLCLGESGAGKSTHTALWIRHIETSHLMNDDGPVLHLGPQGVEAYGTPWSGKTPCYRALHYPTAALVRIEKANANSIRQLSGIEAIGALLPSCPPCFMADEWLRTQTVATVAAVAQRTGIYRLSCLPDAEAARLCYKTVFEV